MQVCSCQSPGSAGLLWLGLAFPGASNHTVSCQGPRGCVSAQPGPFSPICVHFWPGFLGGPGTCALQIAALWTPQTRSQLLRHNSRHNIAQLLCFILFPVLTMSWIKMRLSFAWNARGFQLQNHFQGHVTKITSGNRIFISFLLSFWICFRANAHKNLNCLTIFRLFKFSYS